MAGKGKKLKKAKALATTSKKSKMTTRADARRELNGTKEQRKAANHEQRRSKKLERRRQEKQAITAEMWAAPVPSHLVARLEVPKLSKKHKTYFEIADNHEKKKKLEYSVTNNRNPPPGFTFVPVGDPELTKECKELSRTRDVLILIVSDSREAHSKIAEHVHRAGYHFRESIVEDARQKLGDRVISKVDLPPGFIEPIPATQDEMNRQAGNALLDLFPRIPNTDREMIIRHAFKKGATFQGEPTVGNQADIPLSRRVQLAALAHIRHVHTRYDMLLRETSWMNARKAVEPVCLDILLKWRGDEETGRDQMDEILREVVVITDSEAEEETSDEAEEEDEEEEEEDEDESSDEDDEVTSSSSVASVEIISRTEPRTSQAQRPTATGHDFQGRAQVSQTLPAQPNGRDRVLRDRNLQKGFKRYQAALDEAKNRQNMPDMGSTTYQSRALGADLTTSSFTSYNQPQTNRSRYSPDYSGNEARYKGPQSGQQYSQSRPTSMLRRDEVTMRPSSENSPYSQAPLPSLHTFSMRPPQVVRGSPTKHGLQDLLVPSIETGPSNFSSSSSHVVEHSALRNEREFHPRFANEHRRKSPARREVIVIDDDSPPDKRRRIVHEEPSNFRAGSSLTRPYMQAERFKSPRLRAPVQPGEFQASHPRVSPQPAQAIFHNTSRGEQLPVYDAPDSGFFAAHPRQLGMQEVEYRTHHRQHDSRYGENPQSGERGANFPPRDNIAVFNQPPPMTVTEPSYGELHRSNGRLGHASSQFHAVDHDLAHSFSQSHLGGNPSLVSNQNHPPQRHENQSFSNQTVPQHRYDQPQSFAAPPPFNPRPPFRHVERPMQYDNEPQGQAHQGPSDGYGHAAARQQRQGQATDGGAPTYVRTVDLKRRNVIILD